MFFFIFFLFYPFSFFYVTSKLSFLVFYPNLFPFLSSFLSCPILTSFSHASFPFSPFSHLLIKTLSLCLWQDDGGPDSHGFCFLNNISIGNSAPHTHTHTHKHTHTIVDAELNSRSSMISRAYATFFCNHNVLNIVVYTCTFINITPSHHLQPYSIWMIRCCLCAECT